MAEARITLTPKRPPSTAFLEWVAPALSKRDNWHVGHSLSSRFAFPELRRLQAAFRRRDARQARPQ